MTIETLLAERAWRLRAYLGASADSRYVDLVAALEAVLIEAEHQAARHQLPQFAQSRYSRCGHTDAAGYRCVKAAVTPALQGFLCWNANTPIVREACRAFAGSLCDAHLHLLIVPPASWWCASEPEQEEEDGGGVGARPRREAEAR